MTTTVTRWEPFRGLNTLQEQVNPLNWLAGFPR